MSEMSIETILLRLVLNSLNFAAALFFMQEEN